MSDQIYNHLYPISPMELIQGCKPQKNITVTGNHYEITDIIRAN